jgi:hypothetical protein
VRSSRAPVDHLLAWRAGYECGNAKSTPLTAVRSEQIRQYSTYDCVLAKNSHYSIYCKIKLGSQNSTSSRLKDGAHVIAYLICEKVLYGDPHGNRLCSPAQTWRVCLPIQYLQAKMRKFCFWMV